VEIMVSKVKNRHRLKRRDIHDIHDRLSQTFREVFFGEGSAVDEGEIDGIQLLFIDDEPCFMKYDQRVMFTLHGVNRYQPKEHFVTVDMGAVGFISNGADVMAPGVVDADKNILKNDQVWVRDEKHGKPLAVGIALMKGEEMIAGRQGKAVQVIHFVGDRLWNLTAKSL
jgi:PUA domain protein